MFDKSVSPRSFFGACYFCKHRLIYTICQSVKLTSDLIIILYNKTSLNITKQSFCLWTVVDRQRGLYESQVNFFGQIQGNWSKPTWVRRVLLYKLTIGTCLLGRRNGVFSLQTYPWVSFYRFQRKTLHFAEQLTTLLIFHTYTSNVNREELVLSFQWCVYIRHSDWPIGTKGVLVLHQ